MRRDLIDDRYRLVRLLGRGGFGEVHLAVDELEGREVAIKLIDRGTSDGEQLKRRLQREARATQVLDEARVARAERVGEAKGGQLYVVMPFVAGETVRKRIQTGAVGVDEALRILREIATTLDAAHTAGLVHRDVKPDNIMLATDGRVVLLDFGIVKALANASGEGAAFASTQLTGSGALLGTVSYAAPEQALGNEVDARADQFALAVMAFELLTGQLPWRGDLPARVLTQVLYQTPPRASTLRHELKEAVDLTLERALAKQPEARFTSTGKFIDALENAVRYGTSPLASTGAHAAVSAEGAAVSSGGSVDVPAVRRRGWRTAAFAIGGMALLGVAGGVVERRMQAPVKWASSGRGTLAVPFATLDPRDPCPDWLSGAVAEGLTSQLTADGKTRAIGPRELGPLAHGAPLNRKGIRTAFGADALLEAECARPRAGGDGAVVRVRITSAGDDARELASFEVAGSSSAPAELVDRLADKARSRLGIEPPDAIARARADRTLPQSAEAAKSYVEGLAKLDAFDSGGARAALEHAVAIEPQFAPAHAALAKSFAYLGEQTSAAREGAIAAANASSLPAEDRLLVEADAAASSYAWDRAIESYRAIVKVFPDRRDVALKLIRTYIDAGRVKDARAEIANLTDRPDADASDPRLLLESALVANLAGESAHADDLARRAETLADAVGLSNVSVEAVAAQCAALSAMTKAQEGEICERADRLLTAAGDRMGVLRVRSSWAYVLAQRGRFAEASKIASGMVTLAGEIGSPGAGAIASCAVATIAKRQGDLTTAMEKARVALAQADAGGNAHSRATARLILAGSLLDADALEEGRKYYEEALVITREAGADATTSVILQNLATYWLRKGNITRARENADEALVLCDRVGNEMDRPWAVDEVGILEFESDETAKARDHFAEAMALRTKLGLPMGSSRQNHAEALMASGDLDGAFDEISATVLDYRSKGMRVGEDHASAVLARVLLARGEVRKALEMAEAGIALAHELKTSDDDYAGVHLRAMYLVGRHDEALAAAAVHLDDPTSEWDARLVESELLLRAGKHERALRELQVLIAETHAAGYFRAEHMAEALLAGNLDGGYR